MVQRDHSQAQTRTHACTRQSNCWHRVAHQTIMIYSKAQAMHQFKPYMYTHVECHRPEYHYHHAFVIWSLPDIWIWCTNAFSNNRIIHTSNTCICMYRWMQMSLSKPIFQYPFSDFRFRFWFYLSPDDMDVCVCMTCMLFFFHCLEKKEKSHIAACQNDNEIKFESHWRCHTHMSPLPKGRQPQKFCVFHLSPAVIHSKLHAIAIIIIGALLFDWTKTTHLFQYILVFVVLSFSNRFSIFFSSHFFSFDFIGSFGLQYVNI